MRIPRIYQDGLLKPDMPIELSEQASKHIAKVLRMQVGHNIELFDGKGHCAIAQIQTINKRLITAKISEFLHDTEKPSVRVHLGQVVSKGDRMDYAIQKTVELGVSEITPLTSERCDVKLNGDRAQKKQQHWQNIAISACEQCQQNILPPIHSTQSLSSWSGQIEADIKCLFHPTNAVSFQRLAQQYVEAPKNIVIVIGPEGGFADNELEMLSAQGFISIGLGPRILRTETAPVAALSIIQYVWGDI